MKTPIVIAALVALAACNGAKTEQESGQTAKVAEVDPNADAGFEAVAPGNYDIVHADGKIDHLEVLPGTATNASRAALPRRTAASRSPATTARSPP